MGSGASARTRNWFREPGRWSREPGFVRTIRLDRDFRACRHPGRGIVEPMESETGVRSSARATQLTVAPSRDGAAVTSYVVTHICCS